MIISVLYLYYIHPQISTRENYYEWAKSTLMNALFNEEWYNGDSTEPGFTSDKMAFVVGGARVRQLRVEKGKL